MKRARFGASSEKLGERVEQLELAIEALETDAAERLAPAPAVVEAVETARLRPARRSLRDVLCARIHWPQGDAVRVAAGRAALGL